MPQLNNRQNPGSIQVPITASDVTDLAALGVRSLWVLTDGNLVLRGLEGTSVTYAVTAGMLIPFGPSRVMAASTATCVGWK